MRMNARRIATTSAVGLVALLFLGACAKVDIALTVHDDAVDGSMIMAVDRRFIDTGGSKDAAMAGITANAPTDAVGVKTQPYSDDTYVGSRYVLENVAIGEFGEGPGSLALRHDKDSGTYAFSGVLDLSAFNPDGFTAELASSLDIQIAITFPGSVVRHNGTLDGNTVTWRATPGQRLVVDAVAEESATFPWVVVMALGLPVLFVAAGLVVWLVRRGRRDRSTQPPPTTDPQPEAAGAPSNSATPTG